MNELADLTRSKELAARASALVSLAVARDTRLYNNALEAFAARGHKAFLPRAKDAIEAISVSDEAVPLHPLATAFLAAVEGASALGQLTGAVRIPLTSAARLQVGTVTAARVPEAGQKPTGRIAFKLADTEPTKVTAGVVVTAEALRAIDAGTQATIRDLLVAATARAADDALIEALTAGTPAASADPAVLIAALSGGNPVRPYVLAGYEALLSLASGQLRDLRALGIGIIPSAAAGARVIAIDAPGLLVATDDMIHIQTAREASLTLDDGGSPESTTTVNMWTANLAELRAEWLVRFAIRSGAVAYGATV
jgi:hypothetical protein